MTAVITLPDVMTHCLTANNVLPKPAFELLVLARDVSLL